MTLCPAEPDTGITFRRTDIAGAGALVRAHWTHVTDTRLGTTVSNGDGVSVATVEHLMAAFAGCEIDNALVEITGPEVPVMDGSAEPFVFLIECAGVIQQDAVRRAIRVVKPVAVGDGPRRATLSPGDGFTVHLEIDFDSPAVARQECVFRMVNGVFKSDICRARTFGFLDEVDGLRAAGLVQGGSLDNAVVVSGKTILNDGGLRYSDEFVRHKVLDAIGDLYLTGGPIIGHFHGVQSGHALNCRLLAALFADDEAWQRTDLDASAPSPAGGVGIPASLAASA
jgi:UDP-3-O-[3-hydroxymyristoyl] N-acetylglucosamine deacetylase